MRRQSPWGIKNFKSIINARIDLAGGKTTLITGTNSSGKSSIIQSLLLLTQSIQGENELVLNGPLVRLGEGNKIAREGSDTNSFEVSLQFESWPLEGREPERTLNAIYELSPANEVSTMRAANLTIVDNSDHSFRLNLSQKHSRTKDVEHALEATSSMGPRTALRLRSPKGSPNPQPPRTYVILQGLLPIAIVQILEANAIEQDYRKLLSAALGDTGKKATQPPYNAHITPPLINREFIALFTNQARREDSHSELVQKFSKLRSGNPYAFDRIWSDLNSRDQDTLVDLAVKARMNRPFVLLSLKTQTWRYSSVSGLLEGRLAETLGPTYDLLGSLAYTLLDVAASVNYLGPLRDEPRVVWNHWNELARSLPVGIRGEYSAAVLSRSADSRVTYTSPAGEQTANTLSVAVDEWLAYLGVAQAVSARSHGKLGVGIDLVVNGQDRDLTTVGVGVSQLLPIVVGLLAVPTSSIFAVEQPELHLHPAAQARLADFLLNARPDVAVVIETHSDAIVTRARRRVAEGSIHPSTIDIIFVEPEADGSSTRVLSISEFGDLDEWPEGFVSNSGEDVRAILAAGVRRTARPAHVG